MSPVDETSAERLLTEADAIVDMRAPLVEQISKLSKEQYLVWAHTPHHYAEAPKSARLFRSDAVEAFSKTVWWVVPLVWLPVCTALWVPYLTSPKASLGEAAVLLGAGIFIWTFIEYSLHRFVFHLDSALPDHPAARTLHFLLHGVHHRVPLDRYRLVMPPALLAVLAGAVYAAFRVLIPIESGIITHEAWHALYGSGLLGYVMYDEFHYMQHHGSVPPGTHLERMKRYHLRHHFQTVASDLGFGVTSTAWDYMFGTLLHLPQLPSRPATAGAGTCECNGGHGKGD